MSSPSSGSNSSPQAVITSEGHSSTVAANLSNKAAASRLRLSSGYSSAFSRRHQACPSNSVFRSVLSIAFDPLLNPRRGVLPRRGQVRQVAGLVDAVNTLWEFDLGRVALPQFVK